MSEISVRSFGGIGLFVVYVAASCLGLYLLKAAPGWKSPGFVFGFLVYAAAAVLWLVILRLWPLSVAFPVAAGAFIIGTTAVGALMLQEQVSMLRICGAISILAGITMITWSSN